VGRDIHDNNVCLEQESSSDYEEHDSEEAFNGVKLEVGHFRIFGCLVYIHVPKEKRTKLNLSGRKGTFVGYSESSKAYRIYIPGQRQIEVSKDVTFEEEITFQRSRESQMEIDSEKNE
jgi:hypothetical protein